MVGKSLYLLFVSFSKSGMILGSDPLLLALDLPIHVGYQRPIQRGVSINHRDVKQSAEIFYIVGVQCLIQMN
jgi:hypothetical protein